MLVVSNTSPLSNLAIIGRLGLVREQLGSVIIPPAVRRELERNPHGDALRALTDALQQGWMQVRALAGPVPGELATSLDLGEAETLVLAREMNASLVLLDDSAARQRAGQLA